MRGSVDRRGPNSWRIRFDLGRDGGGKRKVRSVAVRGTKREAQKEMARLLNEVHTGQYVEPSKQSLENYLQHWLDAKVCAPKTKERWQEMVDNNISPRVGKAMLQKLHTQRLKDLYIELHESGRMNGKGGLLKRTVLHVHRLLFTALQDAAEDKIIASNPAAMKFSKVLGEIDEREPEILEQDDLATLLRTAEGTRSYPAIVLAATTGMRRGEVLGLSWPDINFEKSQLTVRYSLEQTKDALRLKEPKTKGSRRTIALPSFAVEVLRAHWKEQAEERLSLGLGPNRNGLVFTALDGNPRCPRSFTKEFTRLVKRAGVPRVTFHQLRHTHLSHLLESGVNIKTVSKRAGHSKVTTTLNVYAHLLQGSDEKASDSFDASLRAALNRKGDGRTTTDH